MVESLLKGMSDLDRQLSLKLYNLGTRVPRKVWKFLEHSGDGVLWLVLTFAIIGMLLVKGANDVSPKAELSLWISFLMGLLLDLIELGLLKGIVRRERPHYNMKAKDMNVVVAVDKFSFPSGHASRSAFIALFCLVTFTSSSSEGIPGHGLIFPKQILGVAVCGWAFVLGMSRCLMGRHYLGDVLAGMCVGVITIALLTQV